MFLNTQNKIKHFYWVAFFILSCSFFVFKPTPSLALTEGQSTVFQVDSSYDASGRSQVRATLYKIGEKSAFYVADDLLNSQNSAVSLSAAINSLISEFDKNIYPTLTGVYGFEWNPGIDNDGHIFILITSMKMGAGGYFNSADEYPKSQAPTSNEREMIYLNASYITSSQVKGYLAHEFQHMINFYQKEKLRNVVEDIWLNEGFSEYASTLCGYDNIYADSNLGKRVAEFLRNSSDSLTEWTNETKDYGTVNLFMQYLVGRYSPSILTKIKQSRLVGIAAIDQALADIGSFDRFADIFTNWTIANYINDCQVGPGQRYCYLEPNLSYARLHVNPSISYVLSVKEGQRTDFSDMIKDWTGYWYEILPDGFGFNLAINFSGEVGEKFKLPFVVTDRNGKKEVKFLSLNSDQQGAELVKEFGDSVKSIVLIPSGQLKTVDFSANEPTHQIVYKIEVTASSFVSLPTSSPLPSLSPLPSPSPSIIPQPLVNPGWPDGTLIRATGDFRVYIIKGKYKRWIQSPEILAAYPHLGWPSVKEVTPAQRDFYRDAWLIRADGDYKVYEINGDMSKHWLNMSPTQFAQLGRSWDMVYIVNKTERDLYKTGADVMK